MNKVLSTTLLLIISIAAFSQAPDLESNKCVSSIKLEPAFVTLSTNKSSKIGEWYQSVFDLKIVKEFSSRDSSSTGVLMKKDEFIVEIIYRDDLLDPKSFKPDSDAEDWKGFMKLGVYTNADLSELKQCLLTRNIKAGRIFSDRELGIDLLQMVDPEGNFLEIISRKTEKK